MGSSKGTTTKEPSVNSSDQSEENKSHLSASPFIAGVLGGGASTVLLYPLDLVKVRFQVNEDPNASSTSSSNVDKTEKGSKIQQQYKRPRSIAYTIRGVVKHEGVVGLYQGLTPALIGSAASWGGYFFFYEGVKSQMLQRKSVSNSAKNIKTEVQLAASENFMAACLSGAIMVVFTNPIWLIKTRMQLQMKRSQSEKQLKAKSSTNQISSSSKTLSKESIKPPYKNMVDAAKTIVKEEGFLALYKGAVPAMMLVSHGGVQFVSYEFLKKHFGTYTKAARQSTTSGEDSKNTNLGVIHRFQDSLGYLTMGAVSKIIASTATYPLQVIKSRLQQRSQTAEISAAGEVEIVRREYLGVIDCITRIWKREGITGFFKGCLPNAIRVAPSAAITFVVYEGIMELSNKS